MRIDSQSQNFQTKNLFGCSNLRKDGKRKGENDFWVVWLREKIGGILVEPKHFLFGPTKNQSLQFRENRGEKREH